MKIPKYFYFRVKTDEKGLTVKIEDASDVEVMEVRHGRWTHGREVGREYFGDCLVRIFYDRWTCSECGYVVDDHEYSGINYKFCPNCGAKMDGGINE